MSFKQRSPLPIIEGGTNTQSFVHAFGVAYYDGGSLNNIDPGTSGYVLTSNGSSAPSFQAAASQGIVTITGSTGSVTGTTVSIQGTNSNIVTAGSGTAFTVALANSPSVSGSVTAGTGLVATTGGLTVTAGTITTPFSSYGALVTNTSGVVTDAPSTAGYVLTGNSGAIPSFQAVSSIGVVTSAAGNTGTATPSSGVLTISGSGVLSSTGSGSTIAFTSTAANSIATSSGTATASSNAFTLTGAGDVTTSASGSTVTLTGSGATSLISGSGTATVSSNSFTIAGGTGITTTASGSTVTITSSGGGGFTWNNTTGSTQAMTVGNGYVSNDGATLVTFTLPSTAAVGSLVAVQGAGSGLWTIAQNASQTIAFNAVTSTSGVSGSVSSSSQFDSITLICITTNTGWAVNQSVGNFNVV